MAKNALKLSPMAGENFEILKFTLAKNALKVSTMVWEIFEIYFPQMAKMHLNFPPWLEKISKFTFIK